MNTAAMAQQIAGIIQESKAIVVFDGQSVACGRVGIREGGMQAPAGESSSSRFRLYTLSADWPSRIPVKGDVVSISGSEYRVFGSTPYLDGAFIRLEMAAKYELGTDASFLSTR